MLFCFNYSLSQSPKDSNFVQLISGQKLFGNVELKEPSFEGDNYILLNDSIKYSIDTVIAFQSPKGFYRRHILVKEFYKRIEKGNIDLYQQVFINKTPSRLNYVNTPYGSIPQYQSGYSYSTTTEYFAKGEGDIQVATYTTLKPVLSDNPESLRCLEQSMTWKYIEYGLIGIGGVCIIAALSSTGSSSDALLISGGLGIAAGYGASFMITNRIQVAVRLYNR
jgi:hypothetical protein